MRIGIIGSGVSGLTCGHVLVERGHDVTVLAAARTPDTTSDVAAAFWYPYRAGPRERVVVWGTATYARLRELADDAATGVRRVPIVHRYDEPAPDPWWNGPVESFGPLRDDDRFGPWVDGYRYTTYLADTSRYMPWLAETLVARGVRFERRSVERLEDVFPDFDVVFNCTGVGAGALADDPSVAPIRGQVVRIARPDDFSDEIRESVCTYVVPRTEDVILGGTADDGDWSREPRPADADRIVERCRRLCPELGTIPGGPRILDHRVGLRPGRPEVRVELEVWGADGARRSAAAGASRDASAATSAPASTWDPDAGDRLVVHDYGHAGAGFTLSWGCAEDAVARFEHATVVA